MNYVISITAPEALDGLEKLCEQLELPLNTAFHGRGTAEKSMLDLLGIESNEKRVMFSVANDAKTRQLINGQKQLLHFGTPGNGIVIAVPIKSIGGGKTMAYLSGDEQDIKKSTPCLNYLYELIVAIAVEGQSDVVMDAARSAGARGGTVLHGKGTGAVGAQKFHNISIAAEKEVVLIVASKEQKSDIMRAILVKAGPGTEANAIVFSLPTTEVAGFGFNQESDELTKK